MSTLLGNTRRHRWRRRPYHQDFAPSGRATADMATNAFSLLLEKQKFNVKFDWTTTTYDATQTLLRNRNLALKQAATFLMFYADPGRLSTFSGRFAKILSQGAAPR